MCAVAEGDFPFPGLVAAGQRLARCLDRLRGDPELVVLGIARGGVPAAIEVACALNAPMDVLLLRRVLQGSDGDSARCLFSVAGVRVADEEVRTVPKGSGLEFHVKDHAAELDRLEKLCRGSRPPRPLAGKAVLLVDNGIRTGGTLLAAIRAARTQRPARVIAAVPVGASQAGPAVMAAADETFCLYWEAALGHVGLAYRRYDVPGFDAIGELLNGAHAET